MITLTGLKPSTAIKLVGWEIIAMGRESKPKTTLHLPDDSLEHTVVFVRNIQQPFKVLETMEEIEALIKAESDNEVAQSLLLENGPVSDTGDKAAEPGDATASW